MSRRSLFFFPILCGLALLVGTRSANADILAEEFFSHPNGDLVGQTPVPGPGDAWVAHDDVGLTPVQVASGKAVLSQGTGSGGREDVSLPFGAQAADALLYARFDFMLPSGQSLTDPKLLDSFGLYFAHFKSNLPTTGFRARTGVVLPSGGGDFGLAINADGSRMNEGATWPTDLSFDTTYRTVISWDAASGESKLWLDPVDESSDSISDVKSSVGTLIEAFALRQSNDYVGTQLIDNLVVATTFAEALAGTGTGVVGGDYNGDGIVDAADYTVWRNNFGNAGAPGIPGDGDNGTLTGTPDGIVNTDDYAYWKSRFGAISGAGSVAAAAVPEPASVLLAVLGWGLLGAICQRNSARVTG